MPIINMVTENTGTHSRYSSRTRIETISRNRQPTYRRILTVGIPAEQGLKPVLKRMPWQRKTSHSRYSSRTRIETAQYNASGVQLRYTHSRYSSRTRIETLPDVGLDGVFYPAHSRYSSRTRIETKRTLRR